MLRRHRRAALKFHREIKITTTVYRAHCVERLLRQDGGRAAESEAAEGYQSTNLPSASGSLASNGARSAAAACCRYYANLRDGMLSIFERHSRNQSDCICRSADSSALSSRSNTTIVVAISAACFFMRRIAA